MFCTFVKGSLLLLDCSSYLQLGLHTERGIPLPAVSAAGEKVEYKEWVVGEVSNPAFLSRHRLMVLVYTTCHSQSPLWIAAHSDSNFNQQMRQSML